MKLLLMAGTVKKRAITEICLYEGTKTVVDSTSEKEPAWYITSLWSIVSGFFFCILVLDTSPDSPHMKNVQGPAKIFANTVSAHLK